MEALSYLVWPGIVALPLVLTYQDLYKTVFPPEWYDLVPRDFRYSNKGVWPSPVGLLLGLGAVVVGQFFMLLYFCIRRGGHLGPLQPIQKAGARPYELWEGLFTHLSQPEGFVLLGGYLIGTWMFGLMPPSYYSFAGGINWTHVALQLLIQDLTQYTMHYLEHKLDTRIYIYSHKPHHRFTNPRLFDAFNGSMVDTILMILVRWCNRVEEASSHFRLVFVLVVVLVLVLAINSHSLSPPSPTTTNTNTTHDKKRYHSS